MQEERNRIIIFEGPQGVGKTTLSNWMREQITYSNLYRLTGHNDKSPSGLHKSVMMYNNLMRYIMDMQSTGVNLIFDRIFITEEVYCRLGYRQYSFTDNFRRYVACLASMSCFDIDIINLQCMDTSILAERLVRDKKGHLDIKFDINNSIRQQQIYSDVMSEISGDNITISYLDTSDGISCMHSLGQLLL